MKDITITIHATVGDDPEFPKMLVDYIMQTVRILDPDALATLTPVSIPALTIPQSFEVDTQQSINIVKGQF